MKNNKDTIYITPTIWHTNDVNEKMPVIKDSPERKEWIEKNQGQYKTKKKTKKKKRVV